MWNEAGREEGAVTPNDEQGVIRLCEVNRDRQRETKEQDRKGNLAEKGKMSTTKETDRK